MVGPIEQHPFLRRAVSALEWAIALFLLLYGLWSFPLALFGPERSYLPGSSSESRVTNYMLEHFHRWTRGQERSYWTAPFLYPEPNTSILVDAPLGTAPLYALFRGTGFNRESAYQIWLLCMFALNYSCCFLVMRAWCGRTALAASGAYIFAFGLQNLSLLEQTQAMPRFMVPVAFYFASRSLRSTDPRPLFLFVLSTCLQFYCSLSIGLVLLIVLSFFFIISFAVDKLNGPIRAVLPQDGWKGILAAAVLGVVVLFPLLNAIVNAPLGAWKALMAEPLEQLPGPLSYFSSHPASLSWQDLSRGRTIGSDRYFMGALPWLALASVPIVIYRRGSSNEQYRSLLGMALTLACTLLVFMNFSGFSLSNIVLGLLTHSPRTMDAVIVHESFFFSLLPILVMSTVRTRQWVSVLIAVLLPLIVVLEHRIDVRKAVISDKYALRAEVDEVTRSITQQLASGHHVITYEPVRPIHSALLHRDRERRDRIAEMLAAQHLDLTTMHGPEVFAPVAPRSLKVVQVIDNLEGFERRTVDTVLIEFGHGQWLTADTSATGLLRVEYDRPSIQHAFVRISMTDGRFALLARNGRFVCAEMNKEWQLAASAEHLGDHGLFREERKGDRACSHWKAANGRTVIIVDDRTLKAPDNAQGIEGATDSTFIAHPLHLPVSASPP
jgi:hypothetical protein